MRRRREHKGPAAVAAASQMTGASALHPQNTLRFGGLDHDESRYHGFGCWLLGRLELTVAPAPSGETLQAVHVNKTLPPGDVLIETVLQVDNPRLWELNDPYLYRVSARLRSAGSPSFDEQSTRCGFRGFRFENGHFRLNGRRIFLKSSHAATHYPIGLRWPHDPDLARRELLAMKVMGFNAIRFFCAVPARCQLDAVP